MRTSNVAEWMSTPPILVRPTTTLAEAQRIMEHGQLRHLPVAEHGRLIGIVTWGDLRAARPSAATTLSVYERPALLDRMTVAECMTHDPVAIAPDATLLDAARLMLDRKIGGLPVAVDRRVVGMITKSDFLRLMIANPIAAEQAEDRRATLACWHCSAVLRRRSFATLGADDMCWQCHYHLHRCENCRRFDGVACMLDRPDRQSGVPGQHCPAFALLSERAISRDA